MPNKEHESDLESVLNQLEGSREPEQSSGDVGEYLSPTVAQLDTSRRPNPSSLCATCPNSLWFATADHLKCYCRLMHVVTWSSEEPKPIVACDGLVLSTE
jgi:hypothetical protein